MKIKKIVLAALFAALTCVATFIIRIPSFIGGYINLGDCMVLMCGWILGPIGFFSAGIGSALADLSAGYALYAPVTFIIKGLMALVAALIHKGLSKKSVLKANALGGIVAEIIMIVGYFVFELIIYDFGGAVANILANAIQGVVGIIAALFLFVAIKKNIDKIFYDR